MNRGPDSPDRETKIIIPVTHASETGVVNRLNLGPDSSGTRFRRRLFHSKPESGVHVTEMIIYDLFLFNLPLATIPAIIITRRTSDFEIRTFRPRN